MAVDPASEYEVREALEELQRYLSDAVPPLTVADSVEVLLGKPPQLVAARINGWASAQGRGNSEIPLSDYLYHAVRKVHLLGEYKLLDRERLGPWIDNLKRLILQYCPPEDREILSTNLARLGEVQTSLDAPVDVVFRQAGTSARTAASDRGAAREAGGGGASLKNLGFLLQRLERELASGGGGGGGGGGAAVRGGAPGAAAAAPMAGGAGAGGPGAATWSPAALPIATQALAEVGRASQTAMELDQHLQTFKAMGVDVSADDVVKALSRFLPGWTLSYPLPEDAGTPPESSAAVAMRKVVTQSEDPAEASHRFNQLVRAAIDRFNEGSLGQAVGAIELAEKLIEEKRVDATIAEAIRRNGDDPIDRDQLRKAAEKTADHPALARFLSFFHRLQPAGIFADLQVERRREARKLLLQLAEAHGAPTRAVAIEQLRPTLGAGVSDEEWFFRRNCVYLLRRIPRAPGAELEEEAELIARHAELPLAPPLVREAIATLGTLKHEKSERALVRLLAETEIALSRPDSPYDRKELLAYLDRTIGALARFGTPTARRAVAEHAVKSKGTGDSVARLAELAGQNLTGEPETVAILIQGLKDELPMKLLGFTLKQSAKTANALRMIEALSATPLPEVRQMLGDITERFPDTDFARAASKALSQLDHAPGSAAAEPAPAAASLTGDLAVFGLPSLLQNFSELTMSGLLALKDPKGETFATLILKGGRMAACQMGRLKGEDAFYEIFERPSPGTFAFTRKTGEEKPDPAAKSVMPMLFEGMRRYDEYERARVTLPDDAVLIPAGAKPTPHPDEKDGMIVNAIWQVAGKGGATARACEVAATADAYRVRRQLQHWIETGALAMKA